MHLLKVKRGGLCAVTLSEARGKCDLGYLSYN